MIEIKTWAPQLFEITGYQIFQDPSSVALWTIIGAGLDLFRHVDSIKVKVLASDGKSK